MQFKQKKFLFTSTAFTFGERELDYQIHDESTSFGFHITYENITAEKSRQTIAEHWPGILGFLGIAYMSIDWRLITGGDSLPSLPAMIIGCLSLILLLAGRRFFKTEATFVTTTLGSLLILPGEQHDQIVAEILKRRKDALRRQHGVVNPLNHAQDEIERFRWLRDENIITPEEFNAAYGDITARQHSGAMS